MAASISKVDDGIATNDASSHTFTSRSFGAAAGDRYIVVGVVSRSANAASISSVTIGGVSATEVNQIRNSADGFSTLAGMFIAAVPTGISGTVAVSYSTTMIRSAIVVWRLVGSTGVVAAHGTGTGAVLETSMNVPAGGVACAIVYNHVAATATWAGVTEDTPMTLIESTASYTSGSENFATEQVGLTVGCTLSAYGYSAFSAAAFEPAQASIAPKMMHYRRLRI